MSDGWMEDHDLVNGIVVSSNKDSTNRVFFINTPKGAAVVFPSLHDNNPSLRIGAYVGVRWNPSRNRHDSLKNFEVNKIVVRQPPSDHAVEVKGGEIQVFCDAAFVASESGIFYLENSYLGRMAGSEYDVRGSRGGIMKTGSVYRVCCRRTTIPERRDYGGKGVHWIIESIDHSQTRHPTADTANDAADGWTTVIMTGCNGGVWYGSGAAVDVVLFPAPNQSIVKGSLHRVKYFTDSQGINTVLEMSPVTARNMDFQLSDDSSSTGNIWCTAHIVGRGERYWRVENEILGRARLPVDVMNQSMRIGDELRTLYARGAPKDDGLRWTVVDTIILPRGHDQTLPLGSHTLSSHPMGSLSTAGCSNIQHSANSKIADEIEKKDRRVLDFMHKFMNDVQVRNNFLGTEPNVERIMQLLQSDRMKM